MELVNQRVTHPTFGMGVIRAWHDDSVHVQFSDGEKKFVYPDGFERFLTLVDGDDRAEIGELLRVKASEAAAIAEEKEARLLQSIKKQKQEQEYERLVHHHKLHPQSQIVFTCEQEELDDVFATWQMFGGAVRSGVRKGQPAKMTRLHQNSVVLLTMKDDEAEESTRLVRGLFMVKKGYTGKLSEDGIIPAHAQYRIELTEAEAAQLPFWRYYTNEKSPTKMAWHSGKYRYFDNEWMAQMLLALYSIKETVEEKQLVQQFLFHFCKLNKLAVEDLPLPTGLLTKSHIA